jgi:O-antigen/teichoic acid export membrane protein
MNRFPVREGTIWLLAPQIVFFLTGYAMQFFLGRRLGPVEYGLFGVVLYATNIIRNFVSSGIPMAVTRYVSADPARAEAVYRSGWRLQMLVALPVTAIFFIIAEPLADWLGDVRLAGLFRLAAPLTIFFGLFFLIFQYYNGLRNYRLQSHLLTGSYLLRAGLVIGLVLLGWGVGGAVAGIVLASLISWVIAIVVRRGRKSEDVFSTATLTNFSVPLIIAAVAQALLTDLDIMFVKRLVPGEASAGYYTSGKTLAQVAPFAFYALSNALYPAVSAAQAAGDHALLRRYVEQSNRLLLMVVLPMIIIGFRNAEAITTFVYGDRYLSGADALRWLLIAFSLLSFFIIHKTIITGCGDAKTPGWLTVVLLPVCVGLQLLLVPWLGLKGAALASLVTFAAGVVGSQAILYARLRAAFAKPSTLRIIVASLAVLAVDFVLSLYSAPLWCKILTAMIVYLGILGLTGEFGKLQLSKLFESPMKRMKRM